MKLSVAHLVKFIWLAALSLATAGPTRLPIGDPVKSTSYVEMDSVFSAVPNAGFAVIRVTVRNDTEEAINFKLSGHATQQGFRRGHSTQSQHEFTAPKEQTSYQTLLVPMCSVPSGGSRGYSYGGSSQSLRLDLTGGANGPVNFGSLSEVADLAAFSKALTTDQVDKFNQDPATASSRGSGGRREFAMQFEHTFLPPDWRALSGLDYVSLSTNEWLQMTAAVRASVLQWVELGGILTLYTPSKETADQLQLHLPAPGQDSYGLGRVRILTWDGSMLRTSHLREQYPEQRARGIPPKTNSADGTQPGFWNTLRKQFGERNFNAWQIGLILILFGLLVGPINLFYFAKAGQRHRLFFTTPLISLGASLLLILFILFQDGTGGDGVQTSLVYVNPQAASVSIHQSQLSRTGVLFGTSFTTDEPAHVIPVILPDSRWTRLKDGWDGTGQNYSQADAKSLGGDWFQSRSEQAQILEMVRSSRGRIELTSAEGQTPVLRSSLGYPLEEIYYVDDKGGIWHSQEALTTGGSASLTDNKQADLQTSLKRYGLQEHLLLQRLKNSWPKRHFFAFTRDPKAEFITTLSSLHWSQQQSMVWGPISVTTSAATTSPP